MIEIRRVLEKNEYGEGPVEAVRVFINGKEIGGGGFGGEPEDNTEDRTYNWVIPLLIDLALELDRTVRQTKEYIWNES